MDLFMDNNISPQGKPAFGGKQFDIKKVIEWLGHVLRCPVCGIKYKLDQTKVVETMHDEFYSEASILIHSDCQKCKSSVMFNVEIRGPEVFSVGMVTDLTRQDTARFKKHKPISANEVIGVHKEIREFKGDFISLFTEKKT